MLISDSHIDPEDPEQVPITYQLPDTYVEIVSTLSKERYSCRGTKETHHAPQYRMLLSYDERRMNGDDTLDIIEDIINEPDEDESEDEFDDEEEDPSILYYERDFVSVQCPVCKIVYWLSLETFSMDIVSC